jgi:hypothetical protein
MLYTILMTLSLIAPAPFPWLTPHPEQRLPLAFLASVHDLEMDDDTICILDGQQVSVADFLKAQGVRLTALATQPRQGKVYIRRIEGITEPAVGPFEEE